MTQDEQTVEEIVEKFQRRFGNSAPRIAMRSPDDCTELAEWLRTTLTKVAEEARREVLRQVMDAHRAEYEAIQKLFPDVDSNSAQILS